MQDRARLLLITRERIRWIRNEIDRETKQEDDGTVLYYTEQTWKWLVEMRKFFPLSSPIPDMEALFAAYTLRSKERIKRLESLLEEQLDVLDKLTEEGPIENRVQMSQKSIYDAIKEIARLT